MFFFFYLGIYQRRLETDRLHHPDIAQRLAESIGSLTFARLNIDAPWLNFINTGDSPEELSAAAMDIVRTTYHHTHPIMTTDHKLQLLDEMDTAIQNVGRQLG